MIGTLDRWNEREFGFIRPKGGVDVFVHASAFTRAGLQPEEGATYAFEMDTKPNDSRLCAVDLRLVVGQEIHAEVERVFGEAR